MAEIDSTQEMLIRQACTVIYQDRETAYRVRLLKHGLPGKNVICRVYPESIEQNEGRIFKERRLDDYGNAEGTVRYLSSFLDFTFLPANDEALEPFSQLRVEIFRPGENLTQVDFDLDYGGFFLTEIPAGSGSAMKILMDHQPGWTIRKLSVSCSKNPPIHVSSKSSNQIAFFERYDGNRYVISTDIRQYLSAWIGFFPILPKPGDMVDFNYQVEFEPPAGFVRSELSFDAEGEVPPPEYRVQPFLESDQIPESEPVDRVTVFFRRPVTLTAEMLP